ncbi:hypothetical protein, partial [Asticcacaulis sp.]|uniref:hypothetical protein n=1 Tax=Asticcacaulis sp. TaxID=1872648 RepID=UPI002621DAE0
MSEIVPFPRPGAATATDAPASPRTAPPRLLLPDAPAIVVGARGVTWVTPDGEVDLIPHDEAAYRLRHQNVILAHARAVGRRLKTERMADPFDLLEL